MHHPRCPARCFALGTTSSCPHCIGPGWPTGLVRALHPATRSCGVVLVSHRTRAFLGLAETLGERGCLVTSYHPQRPSMKGPGWYRKEGDVSKGGGTPSPPCAEPRWLLEVKGAWEPTPGTTTRTATDGPNHDIPAAPQEGAVCETNPAAISSQCKKCSHETF